MEPTIVMVGEAEVELLLSLIKGKRKSSTSAVSMTSSSPTSSLGWRPS